MSIVGTRPPLISETNLYEPHHKARKSYYYGGGIGKSNAPSNANNTETAGQSEWDADD